MSKAIPFDFILEEISNMAPYTKPMFGAYGVYVGDQIKIILRDREKNPDDNGIWIATTGEHHASLQKDLPSMRSIAMFGEEGPTGWQVVPKDAEDFEESALKICEMIRRGDVRVGKVPKTKLRKGRKSKAAVKKKAVVKAAKKKPAKLSNRPKPKSGKKSSKTTKKVKRKTR